MKKTRDRINKIVKVLLALLITFSTLQVMNQSKEVQAASKKASMMLWNDTTKTYLDPPAYAGNQAWQGSKLYWGNSAPSPPMKWRILDTNETTFGSAGILIQGEDSFGVTLPYKVSVLEGYNESVLASVIDGKYDDYLSPQEKTATSTSASNAQYKVTGRGYDYIDKFSGKKWFAPTAKMLSTLDYGYLNNKNEDATRTFGSEYWLASRITVTIDVSGSITSNGEIGTRSVRTSNVARAASSLDTNSILLVSNAESGKASGSVGKDALKSVSDLTNGEYKLTVKDTNQTITDAKVMELNASNVATIQYSKTGPGTSLSAVVVDKDGENILSYGRIANIGAGEQTNQMATVSLPTDFFTSGYKLKVFTEIYNGDKQTDYASDLKEINLSLEGIFKYKDATGVDSATTTTFGADEVFSVPTVPANYPGYRFLNDWIIDPSDAVANGKVQKSFTATAQYIEQYTYEYQDEGGTGLPNQIGKVISATVDKGSDIRTTVPEAPIKAGYRFDKWSYSPDGVDLGNLNKGFIATPVYVQHFKVEFANHDGTAIFDTQWVDIGGNAVDPITRTTSPLDKKLLDRNNYHYSQWESFYDIRVNKVIKALYLPYKFEIKTKYELYAYSKESAKTLFDGKNEADIKTELVKVYDATLYRDGFVQRDYTLDVVIDNLAGLQAGTKGKYEITFNYTNPLDTSFKAQKKVTVKIADTETEKTEAKIAANDFTISTKEAKAIWGINNVRLASAQAYSFDGTLEEIRVSDFSKVEAKPGVYEVTFKANVTPSTGATKEDIYNGKSYCQRR